MRALVTGGGGFLGRAITEQLLARGDEVTILARGRYPEVEALGARAVQADITSLAALDGVLDGIDVVFHTAAKAGVWGDRDEYQRINVEGTRNIIECCWAQGVGRLVYTSSPSATFSGGDAEHATEADQPYPATFEAHYPESKAQAERLVIQANGERLATTALRPHLIYGPGDPHLIPRVLDRHRAGRLRRIGDGRNKVGITYVDNAAAAHLQAADVLAGGSSNAGKAYFITDAEPVALWPWIDELLVGIGEQPIRGSVSLGAARTVGGLLEWVWKTFGLQGEPPITRFAATSMATSHWYDLTAARRDFGYAPPVSGAEGLRRTIEWARTLPR